MSSIPPTHTVVTSRSWPRETHTATCSTGAALLDTPAMAPFGTVFLRQPPPHQSTTATEAKATRHSRTNGRRAAAACGQLLRAQGHQDLPIAPCPHRCPRRLSPSAPSSAVLPSSQQRSASQRRPWPRLVGAEGPGKCFSAPSRVCGFFDAWGSFLRVPKDYELGLRVIRDVLPHLLRYSALRAIHSARIISQLRCRKVHYSAS
jgi:hypothetical protein